MNYLLVQINKHKLFFSCLSSLLIAGAVWLLIIGKAETFIALNNWHTAWLNTFFIYYTYAGDGIFALIVSAICFFIPGKKRQGFALLLAFLFSGLVAQVIKHLVDAPRPVFFFKPGQYSHFIDGMSLSGSASFPSGHTTTAFAMAVVLALFMENKKWQLPLFTAAVLVGYSRIYLGQHFLTDVLMGTFIGTVCGLISVWAIDSIRPINRIFKRKQTI